MAGTIINGDDKGSDEDHVVKAQQDSIAEEADENQIKPEKLEVPASSPRTMHGVKWTLVVCAILSSIFLFSLDNTIVADVQPAIVAQFGAIDKLPWLSVAFTLSAASTNLIWGKMYGQFNTKWLYCLNVLIFEVGSAVCGGAINMKMLIIGRAICGVGGMGMYIGVMTLLSITTTITERPMYFGLTGIVWGTGTTLGPVIGGVLTDSSAGWRWAFYINLCIGGLFAPVYLFMLPSFNPRPNTPFLVRLKEIDAVGGVLLIGAYVSGVMAISFGGVLYDWSSGKTIALFIVSGILWAAFGVQQARAILTTESRRLFPVHFVKSRTMMILFVQIACAATGLAVPLYMLPLFFQFTRGDSALEAGVRLLPFIVFMIFTCILNGAVMSKFGFYMPWYLFGSILLLIGSALLYTLTTTISTSAVYGYSILVGLGTGCFCQAGFSVAQASVPPSEIANAINLITTGQITGLTVALSIANAVFLNRAQGGILALLPGTTKALAQGAIAGVGSSFLDSLSATDRQAVLEVIVNAIRKTFILDITAGALAVILALFMKRERLFLEPAAGA